MTNMTNRNGTLFARLVATAALGVFAFSSSSLAQLDSTWTLMVNGQAVQAEPDGTFRIPNIASPDQLPLGIPGVRPCCDFLGDEPIRVIGFSTFNGITRYAFSEPFRISRGSTFRIESLTIGLEPPPIPVAISITVDMPTLTTLGETAHATVLGTLVDGATTIDVTASVEGTVYRSSNAGIARVDSEGLITATGDGQAFITATNSGATGVTRVIVALGDPLTTLEGFVAFLDGVSVEGAEVSLLALPGTAITDADGFFSIPDLPSQLGQPFTVRASVVVNQQSFVGTAAQVEPVPGLISDAGIITVVTTGGGLGPIIVSGMDPEDHGSPGQQMIRDLMDFVVGESALHASPSKIAMLGGASFRANNAAFNATQLGFELTHFTGQGILDVDLSPRTTRFDAIYMPTSTADISGGITFSDMALINQRGPDIVRFVNAGGGLAAFAQNVSGGYGWLPLGGLQTVNLGGGGQTGIALTAEGIFLLSPSATSVQPFHTAFVGPPEFFGLDVLATESFGFFRPLIIGGLGSIPPDCNRNGLEDVVDLANGTSEDCDENGIPDECDDDCNMNNIPDACDVRDGTSVDVIGPGAMADGVPDECQPDCNGNGVPDLFDIENGTSIDCNGNGVPDDCDLAGGGSIDCNGNAVPDSCDIAGGTSLDCNFNTIPDECDLAGGASADCNANGVPDECDPDCNSNVVPDDCDLASGTSQDCNTNVIPDECDLVSGVSADCNANSTPDECDIVAGTSSDLIGPGAIPDGVPDECQVDCNANLVPDEVDLSGGSSPDCNANNVPDECDVADGTSEDCNGNVVPDECDVATTIVYDIAFADLLDVPSNCGGGSFFGSGSLQPGFTWDDRGVAPVLGVSIAFNVGVECHFTGTQLDTLLNGIPDATYSSTPRFCSCSFTSGNQVTIDANPASYILGGANQFRVDTATSFGFIPRAIWGSGIYARVTVDYFPLNDCNFNSVPDECDLANGTSVDVNGDGLPDECGGDCNANGLADSIDIATGISQDCNVNVVPDECDISGGTSADTIGPGAVPDGVPDDCQADCNANLIPDDLEIADGTSQDCNGNTVPDDCDLAGGTSSDANGNSVPDECQTNVIGLVVDSVGLAVPGATLTANGGIAGTTLPDGSFTILNVPATSGDIVVSASAVVGGIPQSGSSTAAIPVPAGVTDVGTIMLSECGFETDIGSGLNQSDDDSDFVAFSGGFTFPYFGTVQTGVFINSNGNLTFGSGNTTFNPSIPAGVVNGLPRISPAFVDLNPSAGGDVFVNQFADRFVVTWSDVPLFGLGIGGTNTFQVILHQDGRLAFVYNGMTADGTGSDISVAVSPGGSPTLLTVDYSGDAPFSTTASTDAVFENFNSGNTFDLDFHCVPWQPNANGGFDVAVFQFAPCVPTGVVSGVVLDDAGNPVANCPVVVTSSGDPDFLVVTQSNADGGFEVTGVAVPGGVNVRTLRPPDSGEAGSTCGMLHDEGGVLQVIVSPKESVSKDR